MSSTSSPKGFALVLIVLGIVASTACLVLAHVTDVHAWRYGIAGGCFVQFIGWVLHGRRMRGGAR